MIPILKGNIIYFYCFTSCIYTINNRREHNYEFLSGIYKDDFLSRYLKKNSSKVMESRDSSDGLRRRRECLDCSSRFTTYEKTHSLPLTVIKRYQSKEPFFQLQP